MRRLGLLLLVLIALTLSTAMASSMSVQSDTLLSTRSSVSISVPTTPTTPPTTPPTEFEQMRLIGLPEVASLVLPPGVDEDRRTKTAKLQPDAAAIDVESRPPGTGQRAHYVSWISEDTFAHGLSLRGKTIRLELDRKDSVDITVGLFDCPPSAPRATVSPGCRLIADSSSTQADIDIGPITNSDAGVVVAGNQLRLKIVNESATESTIQWGYNSARLVRLVAL